MNIPTFSKKQTPYALALMFALFLVGGNSEAQTIQHKPIERPHPVLEVPQYCDEHTRVTYSGSRNGIGAALTQRIDGSESSYVGVTSFSYGGKYQDVGFLVAIAKSEKDVMLFYKDKVVISKDSKVKVVPVCTKM